MAGLGLVGAGGALGAVDAITKLIAQRKADELMKQQAAQSAAAQQFAVNTKMAELGQGQQRIDLDAEQQLNLEQTAGAKQARIASAIQHADPNDPKSMLELVSLVPGLSISDIVQKPPATPAPKSLSTKNILVNGKPQVVLFDPGTGEHFTHDAAGNNVPIAGPIQEAPPPTDPAMQAIHDLQMEALKDKAAPINVDSDIDEVQGSGRQYLDLSQYGTTELKQKAQDDARAKGIKVLNSKTYVSKLKDIGTARANQNDLMDDIASKLPTGGLDRALQTPGIILSHVLQTDATRAAYGAWRSSAIQLLRALAGGEGSGLRLNRDEIKQALENDIPELTDTLPVAMQKMKVIQHQLDNIETSILGPDTRANTTGIVNGATWQPGTPLPSMTQPSGRASGAGPVGGQTGRGTTTVAAPQATDGAAWMRQYMQQHAQ